MIPSQVTRAGASVPRQLRGLRPLQLRGGSHLPVLQRRRHHHPGDDGDHHDAGDHHGGHHGRGTLEMDGDGWRPWYHGKMWEYVEKMEKNVLDMKKFWVWTMFDLENDGSWRIA